MRLAIILLAAAAVAAGPAAAKPKHRKAVRTYESARPVPGFCQPMCSFDMTPCDPPEYKRADGRCASPLVGGTQMF
ncbi:MAG: hypothetical protein KDJ20_01385 [Hyphomicrobiales bacterium]|nr:hypothetical protein [Rhodoblastus sp.]MCB9999866.1 hypothetical protein [Methylobacteriaceae bacterium]MCC0001562.1 hypothetical protein [Methylobacteriaceae bacterium]MCC2102773.1 hypothetical protein [Hyphomicrobiales bacterium]MCO5087683.1 hypothetical protein [Methylobacteriaceae bacterium]